jgi:hypothetical protein
MKTLPQLPYMQNIVASYYQQGYQGFGTDHYRTWLAQHGFQVPVKIVGELEFPDEFSDQDLTLFMLKWG